MRKLTLAVLLAGLNVGVFSAGVRVSVAAQILPGDLIVTVSNATQGGTSEIVDVNPKTGAQTLIASGGDLVTDFASIRTVTLSFRITAAICVTARGMSVREVLSGSIQTQANRPWSPAEAILFFLRRSR